MCLAEKRYILFCRKTVTGLNKEIQNKTLLHLAETDRLRHTEHQLHASESKVERLNSENIKLRLKIDDLRIKLQNRKFVHILALLTYKINCRKKKFSLTLSLYL